MSLTFIQNRIGELLLFIIAIYSNVHVAFDNDLLTYELLGADFAICILLFSICNFFLNFFYRSRFPFIRGLMHAILF